MKTAFLISLVLFCFSPCRSFCTAFFACWSHHLLFCIRCFPQVLIPYSESVLCKSGTIKSRLGTLGSGCLRVGVGETGGLLGFTWVIARLFLWEALMSVSLVFPIEAAFPWDVSSSPSADTSGSQLSFTVWTFTWHPLRSGHGLPTSAVPRAPGRDPKSFTFSSEQLTTLILLE